MSLEWPIALPAESDQSSLSPSHEDPNDGHPEDTLPALPQLRWRRDALQPPQVQQGRTGRMSFLQAIQVWAPRFRLFGTFIPNNESAGGSAVCIHEDLLPEGAIVTHVIACQGRDRIVNVQSGRKHLVIATVHFKPELTLRRFRERLRLIAPHWNSYPNAVGIIMGDF